MERILKCRLNFNNTLEFHNCPFWALFFPAAALYPYLHLSCWWVLEIRDYGREKCMLCYRYTTIWRSHLTLQLHTTTISTDLAVKWDSRRLARTRSRIDRGQNSNSYKRKRRRLNPSFLICNLIY